MTRNEIIELAKQAEMMPHSVYDFAIYVEELEAFTKLVTSKYEQEIQDLKDMIMEIMERQE